MADEPIQLRRTVNPHPLAIESADGTTVGRLREGEPAIAIAPGNTTKLWIGDGVANRLLLSTDRTEAPLLTAGYAPLDSPVLTGTPTAPTAAAGTATIQLATTEFVANAVATTDEPSENGAYFRERRTISGNPVYNWVRDIVHDTTLGNLRSVLRFENVLTEPPFIELFPGRMGKVAIAIDDIGPFATGVSAMVTGIRGLGTDTWNSWMGGVGLLASATLDNVAIWAENAGRQCGIGIEHGGLGADSSGLFVVRHEDTPGPSIRLSHTATSPGNPARYSRSRQGALLGDIVFAGVKGRNVEIDGVVSRGRSYYANTASVEARATENWVWNRPPEIGYNYGTDEAFGSCLEFKTTENGTITPRVVFRLDHDGTPFVLHNGTLTDLFTLLSGGPGGPVTWGSIIGNLSSQTDLNTALNWWNKPNGSTAIGDGAYPDPIGLGNTAYGTSVLNQATAAAARNVGVGTNAFSRLTSGIDNVAVGSNAAGFSTTGYSIIALGSSALTNITGASNDNIAIGTHAGAYHGVTGVSAANNNTLATRGIYIGTRASASESGQDNEIVIGMHSGGFRTVGRGSNTIVLGNRDHTALFTSAGLVIGNPTGGAMGAGTANIQGPIYIDGKAVEFGADDSAGTGYRWLRIAN